MGIERFFSNYFAKWSATGKEIDQIQTIENDSTIFVKEELDAFLNLMGKLVNSFLIMVVLLVIKNIYKILMTLQNYA